MTGIKANDARLIEESFFSLSVCNGMLFPILFRVALIPLKASNPAEIQRRLLFIQNIRRSTGESSIFSKDSQPDAP